VSKIPARAATMTSSASNCNVTAAFSRLHPGVQRWLYEQRWTQLRPIQIEAIEHLIGGSGDLIIAAKTASGKTEAAFLPILSLIANDLGESVRAMYVGPLRALINDQFRRMELLCGDVGIPVHKWHGEVGQGARNALLADPGGVLLITPESLEAFFVRRQASLDQVFSRLAYIVIDELHVFPGTERGMHLRSLLHRLEQRLGRTVRRVGLSATLGDLDRYRRWLRPTASDHVALINHGREGTELKTRCYAFIAPDVAAPSEDGSQPSEEVEVPADLYPRIAAHHKEGINLLFANAKRTLEQAASCLKNHFAAEGLPEDRILIHHGSLSREIREEAEALLQAGGCRICCCSSTLELGIDIGSVKAVGHIDAPWSVASLAQRLGRSGRRDGESSVFRQYHVLDSLTDIAPHDENHLRPGLVRGVALMQLYLDGWCESAAVDASHSSTLVHQIISVIGETGGIRADALYRRLISGNGFSSLPPARFTALLRHLGEQTVIEQLSDGSLLLGDVGERELNDRGFYAAFATVDAYEVINGDRRIGTVSTDNAYQLGDGFRLAGRGWDVEEIDEDRLRVYVKPSSKRNLPKFSGMGGQIHDRVIEQMRQVLIGTDLVPFLDPVAMEALLLARVHARRHGLGSWGMVACDVGTVLWPWRGTRCLETLTWLLRAADLTPDAHQMGIVVGGASPDQVRLALDEGVECLRDRVIEGLTRVPEKLLWRQKYDHLVPTNLLLEEIIADRLDLDGARTAVLQMTRPASDAHGGL